MARLDRAIFGRCREMARSSRAMTEKGKAGMTSKQGGVL
jgi:hypothetical protein